MADPQVLVRIKASNDAAPAFQGLDRMLDRVRGQVGLLANVLTTAAVGSFLGKTVHEAADAESKLSELQAAVTNAGGDFDALRGQTDAAAQAVQRFSRFSDDDARAALANLVTVSGDVQGSLTNLQVVVDLAAARHIDLGQAADIVGKAMAGNTTQLARLYPQLKNSSDAVGDLGRLLAGRAAADAKTFSGSLEQMKNALKDVEEATGNLIVQNGVVTGILQTTAKTVKGIAEDHAAAASAVVLATTAAIGLTVALPSLAAAIKVVQFALATLNVSLGPVGLIIAGLSVAIGLVAYKAGLAAEQTAKLRREVGQLSSSADVLARITALSQELATTPATLPVTGPFEQLRAAQGLGPLTQDNPRRKAIQDELNLLAERLEALRRLETATGQATATEGRELEVLQKLAALHLLDARNIQQLERLRASLKAQLAAGTLKGQAYLDTLGQLRTVEDLLAGVAKDVADRRKAELDTLTALTDKTELTAAQVDRLRRRYDEATAALARKNLTDAEQNRLLDEQRQAFEALEKIGARTSNTFTTKGSRFGIPTGLPPIHPQVQPGADPFAGIRFGPDASEDTGGFFAGGALLGDFDQRMRDAVRHAAGVVEDAKTELDAQLQDLGRSLRQTIAQTLGASLAGVIIDTIQSAFDAGSVSGLFAGFGKAVLAALGNIFVQMGSAMIAASPLFQALAAAMANPFTAGPALLLYGAALVALGATLGAIAHGIGGGGGGGGGSPGRAAPGDQTIRITVQAPAADRAATLQPRDPIVYAPVFIGKDDQRAQRELVEMLTLADERGYKIGRRR